MIDSKILLFTCAVLLSIQIHAQNTQIAEGYDKITLDGQTAYMNLVTGEVSYTLPKAKATKKIAKKEEAEYNPFITHFVQKGETLYKIARKYKISIQDIYKYNNANANDHLYVGQEIVVGLKKINKKTINDSKKLIVPFKYHKVKPNETLYRIALKNHISVQKLKALNNLQSNTIFVGQKLKVQ